MSKTGFFAHPAHFHLEQFVLQLIVHLIDAMAENEMVLLNCCTLFTLNANIIRIPHTFYQPLLPDHPNPYRPISIFRFQFWPIVWLCQLHNQSIPESRCNFNQSNNILTSQWDKQNWYFKLTYEDPDGSIMYISGPVCGSHATRMALTPNGRTALYKVYAWMKLDRRSFNTFNGIGRSNCCL